MLVEEAMAVVEVEVEAWAVELVEEVVAVLEVEAWAVEVVEVDA